MILIGASSVPVTIPADVTSLDGQSLTFVNSNGFTTEVTLTTSTTPAFDEIQYFATDTPDIVATRIANALQFFDSSLGGTAVGDQLFLPGARGISLGPAFTAMTINPTSFNGGITTSQYLTNGNVPIFYNETMTSVEVRDAIREAFVNGLGAIHPTTAVSTATIANFPEYATNRIRLFNSSVFGNTSPIGFSEFLPGDEFGAAGSSSISSSQINTRPATNNNVEGLYIDDIVVGFAERGEMVFNAPVNRNFDVLPETRTFTYTDSQQPEYPNEILVGEYTLEIRTSAEYGVPEDYDPIRLELNEQFGFGRSFDTNDRLVDGVTLIAPSGADLIDGDRFAAVQRLAKADL